MTNLKKEIQLILNSTHDAMIAVDKEGIITIFNTAAQKLTKISEKNAIGKHVEKVISTTRLPHILKTGISELNQRQYLGDIEIITNRMPVLDNNEIIGAIAVFRDFTEVESLAEQITDLNEVRIMLEAIINSTEDAISVVDENGKGVIVNPAYTKITGFEKDEVIGKECTIDLNGEDSVHLMVLETQKPVKSKKLRVGKFQREAIVDAAPIIVNGQLKGSVAVIHDLTEILKLSEELDNAKRIIRSIEAKYTFEDIKGNDQLMQDAILKAKLAAMTPATVLLRGESGTGKELFAHAIHNDSSRKYSQFVRVNCAAISENLIESELFGYEEGAFTGALKGGKKGYFEMAHKGTIFLDEIAEINVNTQAKLLRVLQEKEILRVGGTKPLAIDVRVIAATNVDLEKAVEEGKFRKDLYYRLNLYPIKIPSLREHTSDIDILSYHITNKYNREYGRNITFICEKAIDYLKEYNWPGNVRELENVIARAIINMNLTQKELKIEHLPQLSVSSKKSNQLSPEILEKEETQLDTYLDSMERNYIIWLLDKYKNKTKVAKILNISIRSLYYKLDKHNVQ
jgi:PAS domain S-box-containing protein